MTACAGWNLLNLRGKAGLMVPVGTKVPLHVDPPAASVLVQRVLTQVAVGNRGKQQGNAGHGRPEEDDLGKAGLMVKSPVGTKVPLHMAPPAASVLVQRVLTQGAAGNRGKQQGMPATGGRKKTA